MVRLERPAMVGPREAPGNIALITIGIHEVDLARWRLPQNLLLLREANNREVRELTWAGLRRSVEGEVHIAVSVSAEPEVAAPRDDHTPIGADDEHKAAIRVT